MIRCVLLPLALLCWSAAASAQTAVSTPPAAAVPGQGDGVEVRLDEAQGLWRIEGRHQRIELVRTNLSFRVVAGGVPWQTEASQPGDLRVRAAGKVTELALAAAGTLEIAPYRTGYQSGVKIDLGGYRTDGQPLDLALQVFLCLEGPQEDLVVTLIASDGAARVESCDWPPGLAPGAFDATVVPFMQGMLLPKDWPEKTWLYDTLCFGRGLYQPWWGHLQGNAALLLLLETPDDAGCHFQHPAGGPTRVGPRWVSALGRWAYPRRARFCFLPQGDHVDLAKRYRRHAVATGRFVSLREKIARNPRVTRLIGAPVVHTSILYHIQPESSYYKKDDPAQNHQLVTFEARAKELEALRALGITSAYVHLDGWGFRGYDNLHPDVLPPSPEAGGWEGMKRFAETCDALGFVFAIHDQYRDFYLDAPSYHERHTATDASGHRPLHSTWYGGRQSILCPSLAPGYVRRNHAAILDHDVRLRGAYLDVFSVVPPDECHQTEHPVTRTECLRYRGECLDFVRSYGGIVSSEEPSDWSVPYLDLVHHGPFALAPGPGQGKAMGIPVPLFNLVYHDALCMPWALDRGGWGIPEKDLAFLHALANGGMPYLGLNPGREELEKVRTVARLHARVALLELTRHEFLDAGRRRQRTTFADGTRVTIDLDRDAWSIEPPL